MRKNLTLLIVAVLSMLAPASVPVFGADPSEALDCSTLPAPETQAQLAARPDGCRFFVADPGLNRILDQGKSNREDLLAAASVYNDYGFTDNFLWYAYEEERTFTESNNPRWTGCLVQNALGALCPSIGTAGATRDYSVFNSFGGARRADGSGSVDLDVYGFGDMWIARVCGNWYAPGGEPRVQKPKPVPTIPIEKFNDANRNGIRDAGEGPLSGVQFVVRRTASRVGEQPGVVGQLTTNGAGQASFELDGHGPGTYTITETVPAGTFATTPTTRTVQVDFGIGNGALPVQRFGNAPRNVDVAKTNFSVSMPENFEARTDGEVTVDVTITNNGPADHVPVTDEVLVGGPDDCVITPNRHEFSTTLRVGESASGSFTFTVNCDRPSFHDFTFDDLLVVDDSRLQETDLSNNRASVARTRPVLAETDLASTVSVTCPPGRTEVGVPLDCDVQTIVANDGYGPIAGTLDVSLEQGLAGTDCTISPSQITHAVASIGDGERKTFDDRVTVVCDRRSDHRIIATSSISADDIHVIDVAPSNNTASAAGDFEVFHDAELSVDDISLFCDESLGQPTITCTADVTVSNAGPAPDVIADVVGSIETTEDCTVSSPIEQQADVVLAIGEAQTVTFSWTSHCTNFSMLHPFRVTADVAPDEPHAVDEPGQVADDWTVPFCMPTVNPSGNNEPAAPGNGGQGQNQDGFYTFGAKTLDESAQVWIEDSETGTVFGPFDSGVRIKYTEANGAPPSISEMGGNNGNGNGRGNGNGGTAVDFQIRGRGDANAVFFDEDGNVIRTACLVPPFPR